MGAVMDKNELRLLFWETTAGCNLECIHCRRLDVSRQLMHNDLTTAEALQLVRGLASFAKPILVLSGGEPLFRPDIFQIAVCARECGLLVALATNGTLIDEPWRTRSWTAASSVSPSASTARMKPRTTISARQPGSLAAALNGFRHLRRLGMSMQINCTVTKHNVHQIEKLYATALELGADALHLFMLVPVGCGVQIAESNMLPSEEYERVLNWMYDKSKARQIHLKATCAPHYFRVMRQRATAEHVHIEASHSHGKPGGEHPGGHNMAAMTKGCLAGSSICFVSHTGEVFPAGICQSVRAMSAARA